MLNVTWHERLETTIRFLATLLLGFALAWFWQGNKIRDIRQDAINKENTLLRDKNSQIERLEKDRDAMQARITASDAQHIRELSDAQEETKRLARCIANGTCGLRVKATCPSQHPAVPTSTAAPASVDDGIGPTLTPEAQQDYYSLRDGIAATEGKLKMCQDYVRSITQ